MPWVPSRTKKQDTVITIQIGPSFATGTHSATLIPVFAYGPGAEAFKGMYQNTEIFHKMAELLAKGEITTV